jgi:hypothetical protein
VLILQTSLALSRRKPLPACDLTINFIGKTIESIGDGQLLNDFYLKTQFRVK